MDTKEHTELGNALRVNSYDNPYLRNDEKGILHIRLQRFGTGNLPELMPLEMSTGEIVAMAGDYFTEENWNMKLNLPPHEAFHSTGSLGQYLINSPIDPKEEIALITAYNNLADPKVTRQDIDLIYKINNSTYIPFSSTLNFYAQQLMFSLRVKDYGEMLYRNQTHFTPWSVKVYLISHNIALRYARLSFELKKLAANSKYQSDNSDIKALKQLFQAKNMQPSNALLIDMAHRYHAQAICMETFGDHYYSDHFAAGHTSMMGDMRVKLPQRFGVWGSILANSLHDEVNRLGIYTTKLYDPNPDLTKPPVPARGDGLFDSCINEENRKACVLGLQASMGDIDSVINGGPIPHQTKFAGLAHLPDVDYNFRQHQPLLVMSRGIIFYRNDLSKTRLLSPTEYEALKANPAEHGYSRLDSKWTAFLLVVKLRLFSYLYNATVAPVSVDQMAQIIADEKQRNPLRAPISEPVCAPDTAAVVVDWRNRKSTAEVVAAATQQGLLANRTAVKTAGDAAATAQDFAIRASM